MTPDSPPALPLADVPELRRRSEAIAEVVRQRLVSHLDTLRSVFAPERIFGRLAGGRLDLPGSDQAVAELQDQFRAFAAAPFNLTEPFEASWLSLVSNSLEVQPYEYPHAVGGKTITITSPVRWVVGYKTHYSLARARQVLSGREPVRSDYLRLFVVNALVLQSVINRSPGLARLLADLRFEVRTDKASDLRGLPITTVGACLPSFRPPDDVLSAAMAFSGVAAFIELIDLQAARQLNDPFRDLLNPLLG